MRDLKIDHYIHPLMPEAVMDWKEAELEAYRGWLERTGRFTPETARRWANTMAYREERRPFLGYASTRVCSQVLAELPFSVLAARRCYRSPELALLCARFAEVRDAAIAASASADRRYAANIIAIGERLWRRRPGLYASGYVVKDGVRSSQMAMPGLSITVRNRRVTVSHAGGEGFVLPATREIGGVLRRLLSLWRRIVRTCVALSFEHALPKVRTLASRLQLALRAATWDGAYVEQQGAWIASRGFSLLPDDYPCQDKAARHDAAGGFLRSSTGNSGPMPTDLATSILGAVERTLAWMEAPFTPLRPALASREEILARADDTTRKLVRAWCGARAVALEDASADRYEVFVGDPLYPTQIAEVHALETAVDLERSNRRDAGTHRRLATG